METLLLQCHHFQMYITYKQINLYTNVIIFISNSAKGGDTAIQKINFSAIASKYEDHSLIQGPAADMLLDLLYIKNGEDVLDLGCGSGNPTRKIREMTTGRVLGIDPSEGMIKEAIGSSKDLDIIYEIKSAEELDCKDCFDVIFCNSAFQWFSDPERAVDNCYNALRKGGRVGIQAPAKRIYSPNFVMAIEMVKEDPRTQDTFAHFKEPWFLLESEDEYRRLFERHGFKVVLSRIDRVETKHTVKDVFNAFLSAAIVGYLNQDFYDTKIDEGYTDLFKDIVKDAFVQQADEQGKVNLVFNRLFLLAVIIQK